MQDHHNKWQPGQRKNNNRVLLKETKTFELSKCDSNFFQNVMFLFFTKQKEYMEHSQLPNPIVVVAYKYSQAFAKSWGQICIK